MKIFSSRSLASCLINS